MAPKLCVPVTDIYLEVLSELRPFVGALEFKNCKYDRVFDPGLDKLFESPLGIISDEWASWMEKEQVFKFMNKQKIVSYSCDLGPACRTYQNLDNGKGVMRSFPSSPKLSQDQILDLAAKRSLLIKQNFAGTIKYEILNYYPTGCYDHICEPLFIKKFLEATGGELLLDLAHARISAENLHIPFMEYLDSISCNKITEIHLSRPLIINGEWEDAHEKPLVEDIAMLKQALKKFKEAEYLVIEYYKDKNELVRIYKEVFENING